VAWPEGHEVKGVLEEIRLLFVSGAPRERKNGSARAFSVSNPGFRTPVFVEPFYFPSKDSSIDHGTMDERKETGEVGICGLRGGIIWHLLDSNTA